MRRIYADLLEYARVHVNGEITQFLEHRSGFMAGVRKAAEERDAKRKERKEKLRKDQ